VVGLSAIAAYLSSVQSDAWATHTLDVRLADSGLVRAVTHAQAEQLGFHLTGEEDYLRLFDRSEAGAPAQQHRLRELTRDKPAGPVGSA